MRTCTACRKEDAPWFEQEPCSCGHQAPNAEPILAIEHDPGCKCISHEVVAYPVRIAKQDLTFDQKLPAHYVRAGWILRQNGQRFYRVKMLCRDCIGLEEGAQARRVEYERACKATLGIESQSYSQMLASQ
jgi:hypothetical protein